MLGTCRLDTAVILTALQRAINRYINKDLRISYDTSSPFRIVGFGNIYTVPNFETNSMTMGQAPLPDHYSYIGSQVRWPWPSPLGDRINLGDVCVRRPVTANTYHDTLSNHILSHHNLAALCYGIALANRIFDGENVTHQHTVGCNVGGTVEVIENVLKAGTMSALQQYKRKFLRIRNGAIPDSGEDERDF